jgi:hypothetical protein
VVGSRAGGVVRQLSAEYEELTQWLSFNHEQIQEQIAAEQNPDRRKALEKRGKALSNIKGREGLEKQVHSLCEKISLVESHLPNWWEEQGKAELTTLQTELDEVAKLLQADELQFDSWIAAEADEKKSRILAEKKIELLSKKEGSKGRAHYESELSRLSQSLERYQTRFDAVNALPEAERLQRIVMEFSAAQGNAMQAVFRSAAARDVLGLMPQGFRQELQRVFTEGGIAATPERIAVLANLSRQYIYEHYLFNSGDIQNIQNHAGHAPFSDRLHDQLSRVWQQQLETNGKELILPIENFAGKLKALQNPGEAVNGDAVKVTMVPGSKILKVMAPYIGDMCATKQDVAMASGELPGLYSYIYVVNHGKSNESFRGSLFCINTATEAGVPCLVGRGNNPRENFIQAVDADNFTKNSLLELIKAARRLRLERMQKGDIPVEQQRQKVAIPLDNASQSCSNRKPVAEVYKRRFGKVQKIRLVNEPATNFNGYKNWSETGSNACGTIWEIDENGVESWHGNWN